jgi:hypothetical protein
LQGVYKRSLQGNASASNAGDALEFAKECARLGTQYLCNYMVDKKPPLLPKLTNAYRTQSAGLFDAYMSDKAKTTLKDLTNFMRDRLMPNVNDIAGLANSSESEKWTIHPKMEQLKFEAKNKGLWNLFIPLDTDGGLHGAGFTNLEYARMAEITGYSMIAPEIFNCSAPDTGKASSMMSPRTP